MCMQEITKAQEDILKVLWIKKEGAISDLLDILPNPKPAYNAVATVIKVLEKKKYVSHKTFGKTNVYFALISRKEYGQYVLKDAFKGLYNNSLNQMVSGFVKGKDVSLNELEELKQMIEIQIKKQKT